MRDRKPLDIALVGMACRFPGAGDLFAYWQNILAGRDATGDVPADRWDPAVFFDPDSKANDRVYCKRGGYLDSPIPFDPAEHGIMPMAVAGGEPEQFLILDAARAALADAGLAGGIPDGRRVEVVIGRGNYFNRGNLTRLQHGRIIAQTLAILRDLHPAWGPEELEAVRADLKAGLPPFDAATVPGQLTNATAGRIADRLDLTGASFVVDAASASALVALDLGARALAERRADLALIGGVYVAADVDFPMVFCQLGALSRQGRARPFSRDADGTLPGEGVGVVVLKRLADAERDGDRIYAVLKGVGIASDGRGKGLAAPSARGHVRAMRRAYRQAGVNPGTVDLIEGHGLGVPAADRAELRALRAVFPYRARHRRALGAVSSMIGHAMPAAGIAGLIKTALALHHRVLPPTLYGDPPHPLLAAEDSPFRLIPATRPWVHDEPAHPRRAGVNAFGFAGISTHAVLEEHPATSVADVPGCMLDWDCEAILLGAPDRASWLEVARALLDWLGRGPEVRLKDLAYTLNTGQPSYPFRVGLVATSLPDLEGRLRGIVERLSDLSCRGIRDARGAYFWDEPLGSPGALAFLFPGEGSQYPGMLADLCPHFPEVLARLDATERVGREGNWRYTPSEHLFSPTDGSGDAIWSMETAISGVITSQLALHELLARIGLRPDAIVGHSSGEFVALVGAGVLRLDRSLEDRLGGLGTIFQDLESSGDLPRATLVAVAADRARVEAVCQAVDDRIIVAMDNCPHQVVLAGPPETVEVAVTQLRGQGIVCEILPFSRAYHTRGFAPALGPVRDFFADLPLHPAAVPLYSCALADRMPSDLASIRHLGVDQWTRPVEFRSTVERLYADGIRIFVEVGARGNLTGFVEDILRGRPAFAIAANLPRRSGLIQLNHLVAAMFAQGVALRPDHLYARRRPERIDFSGEPRKARQVSSLAVGFPEMRLSPALVETLRKRETTPEAFEHSNGSTHRVADLASPLEPTNGHFNGHEHRDGEGLLPHALETSSSFDPARTDVASDEAMLAYLRTMEEFLETQRQVMGAYLGQTPLMTESLQLRATESSLPQPGNLDSKHEPSPSMAVVEATDSPAPKPVLAGSLMEKVSRRTGYPIEMLKPDLDLEGDLGIDSIKRVEIFGELQGEGLLPPGMDLDRLSLCRTLRQVLDFLAPGVPSERAAQPGPWVGDIRHLEPGRELVSVRRLDLQDDPVAEHHTLGGRRVSAIDPERKGLPVVPFTVMTEMLAQAAAVLVPGRVLLGFRDVKAHRWIRYEEDPIFLELRARRDSAHGDLVRVEIANKGSATTPRAGSEGPVVEGVVVFGHARDVAPTAEPFVLPDTGTCRFTADELYIDQWLFHGPALRALVKIGQSTPHGIEGTLCVLPRRGLLRDTEADALLTDPILLDAFTHLLGCWGLDKLQEGDLMFPLRLREIQFFGDDPPEGSQLECQIWIRQRERHIVRVDAQLVLPDGRVWTRILGWEDWRFHWPGRYRDHFRMPDKFFVGEVLEVPELPTSAQAVWLEPPADMGRPVWRDVLEWVQLGPDERAALRALPGPESRITLRLWGRVAAKEAARRLWDGQGHPSVYPADLLIQADEDGRPHLRSLLETERRDMPTISIAHTGGVAVAMASLDPRARVGIDVERVVERTPGFEATAFLPEERAWLDRVDEPDRAEWVARLWCAKEAAAKATGFGMVAGPSSVLVLSADPATNEVLIGLGSHLTSLCPDWDDRPVCVATGRRGEYVWACLCEERIDR